MKLRSKFPTRSSVDVGVTVMGALKFAEWKLALGLLAVCSVGCHAPDNHGPEEDLADSAASETRSDGNDAFLGLPTSLEMAQLDGESRVPTSDGFAPSGVRQDAELVSFQFAPLRRVDIRFGGLVDPQETDSAALSETLLIQAPALPGDEDEQDADNKSASDRRRVEVIPTPNARPEIKAEIIPTPPGVPDPAAMKKDKPIARIAADVGDKAPKAGPDQKAPERKLPENQGLLDPSAELAALGNMTGPEDFTTWRTPDAAIFITGDQHGYIEPCGCTGLEKQKGGVARRYTFMKQLRDQNWPLVPIDAGNQIRRIGQQAAIKFSWSNEALKQMKYRAIGFGPADMRLGVGDLIQTSLSNEMFASANVVLVDPSFVPSHKLVHQGEWHIGLTSILDPMALLAPTGSDVKVNPVKEAAEKVLKEMNAAGANFRVLTFFGEEEAGRELMGAVPGFDLIIVSGGYGEPTYRPQAIEGSKTKLLQTGNKGMYVGLVGLYTDKEMTYARVPLTHEYSDAPEMRKLMADYQKQLEDLELSGLGVTPIPHPSGHEFVGTAKCGECHTTAKEIWDSSMHALATEHIVKPPKERGDVARHFDPECISCHVTGWNAENYYPYKTGYLSLTASKHLLGNGCENCHGPGSAHVAAEQDGSDASDELKKSLRLSMQLPLEKAKEHCMKCHDLDNSPEFHEDGAFEDVYWPEIEHEGVD